MNYLRRGLSPARESGLSRAQIALAVPAGSRRPRLPGGCVRVLQADPELDGVRADFREHVLEFARIHARYACWQDMTSRPTRARVCELAGFGISTYKACRRWLETRGYLGLVEPGSTPEFRPRGLCRSPDDRNTAAVYVLCVPRAREKRWRRQAVNGSEITRPPSGSSQEPENLSSREDRRDAPDLAPLKAGPLKNLSDKALAACARPFLAAGWTVADLAFAVDHWFTGEQHRWSLRTIRRPAGWLRWRLRQWIGGDGRPLPSRSQQLEASAPPLPAGWQRMRPLPSHSRQVADAIRRGWRPERPVVDEGQALVDAARWAARIRAGFTGRARSVQDQLDLGLET